MRRIVWVEEGRGGNSSFQGCAEQLGRWQWYGWGLENMRRRPRRRKGENLGWVEVLGKGWVAGSTPSGLYLTAQGT